MPSQPDYYQILGVSPTAGAKDIKAAYRALAKKLHPDVGGSAEQLAAVNEAADVLTDPKRREAYDRDRRTDAPKASSARTASPPPPPRPRQKVSIALCDFCGTMNRVKDDPDYVAANCGKCGRPLGKAGAAPSPPPPPPHTPPPAAKPEDADSYASIFADAVGQIFGGGLKHVAKDLPGAGKVMEGLQEMRDHLAKQARGKGSEAATEAKDKLAEFEEYLKKIKRE